MDELKAIFDFFGLLFSQKQQAALGVLTLCVMSATQAFKYIWFGFFPVRRQKLKAAMIHLFALCAGIVFGAIGYFVSPINHPLWFWMVSGLITSMLAIGAFKLIIEVIWLKWIKRNA